MNTAEVYEKVTAKLIAAMEGGVVPWAKPWRPAMSAHGHVYRGINAMILGFSDYASPIWMTFEQARKLGGHVRKGEKGTPVMLWKSTKSKRTDAETGEERAGFYGTTFTVFNYEQTEGVVLPAALRAVPESTQTPVEAAEALVASYPSPPAIETIGNQACYVPSLDAVRMPARGAFKSVAGYYSTLFHELAHSTGHASRLAREGVTDPVRFGSHTYSREELIAEMGAAFMCAQTGIENDRTIENSAAYLQNWLGVLRGDRKLLVQAASAAQKAVDHITRAGVAQESVAA
jgi:antirestriction protein ArdC